MAQRHLIITFMKRKLLSTNKNNNFSFGYFHDIKRRSLRAVTASTNFHKTTDNLIIKDSSGKNYFFDKVLWLVRCYLLFVMLITGSFGYTTSFYNDTEQLDKNYLKTGSLDFVLKTIPFSDIKNDNWQVSVIPENNSNPFYYYASSTNINGDVELCENLKVKARAGDELMYEGLLSELVTATTTDLTTWTFSFDNWQKYVGQTCYFSVDYKGWQTRHGMNEGGYNDIETVDYKITIPSVLISKVYFNFDKNIDCRTTEKFNILNNGDEWKNKSESSESGNNLKIKSEVGTEERLLNNEKVNIDVQLLPTSDEEEGAGMATIGNNKEDAMPAPQSAKIVTTKPSPNTAITIKSVNYDLPLCSDVRQTQDWVELYNLTDQAIDIKNWSLCGGNSCDLFTDSQSIPANGYLLVAEKPSIHTELSIPQKVPLFLVDDGQIGDGLFVKSGMLQLKNKNNDIVDQLNWGEVDKNWNNYQADLWPENQLIASAGKALTRFPVGHDTNSPADFISLIPPIVSWTDTISPYPIVQAGDNFEINWQAENPNGEDKDLKIDLYYFQNDELHLIALNEENDGSYIWRVPNHLQGEIRIKLVATAPENPLLNTRLKLMSVWVVSAPLQPKAWKSLKSENNNRAEDTNNTDGDIENNKIDNNNIESASTKNINNTDNDTDSKDEGGNKKIETSSTTKNNKIDTAQKTVGTSSPYNVPQEQELVSENVITRDDKLPSKSSTDDNQKEQTEADDTSDKSNSLKENESMKADEVELQPPTKSQTANNNTDENKSVEENEESVSQGVVLSEEEVKDSSDSNEAKEVSSHSVTSVQDGFI